MHSSFKFKLPHWRVTCDSRDNRRQRRLVLATRQHDLNQWLSKGIRCLVISSWVRVRVGWFTLTEFDWTGVYDRRVPVGGPGNCRQTMFPPSCHRQMVTGLEFDWLDDLSLGALRWDAAFFGRFTPSANCCLHSSSHSTNAFCHGVLKHTPPRSCSLHSLSKPASENTIYVFCKISSVSQRESSINWPKSKVHKNSFPSRRKLLFFDVLKSTHTFRRGTFDMSATVY